MASPEIFQPIIHYSDSPKKSLLDFREADPLSCLSGYPKGFRQGLAVMRPILAYACPVWGYAAKTNINILDTLQNSLIRMIVKAIRYMRNDDIRNALKIKSFKSHIQNIAN
ncbi:uncharacterized protein TNCV_3816951 [Trichonephila clavipes]|nr:uncharacterized protein TNCV_3816951 [Trichonephila clavipes]